MISRDLYLFYTYCFCYVYNATTLPLEKRKWYLNLFAETFRDNAYAKNRLLNTQNANPNLWQTDIDSYIAYTLYEPNPEHVCFICILCTLIARFYAKGNFDIPVINDIDKYINKLSGQTLNNEQNISIVNQYKTALKNTIINAGSIQPTSQFTTDMYNIYWYHIDNNIPIML